MWSGYAMVELFGFVWSKRIFWVLITLYVFQNLFRNVYILYESWYSREPILVSLLQVVFMADILQWYGHKKVHKRVNGGFCQLILVPATTEWCPSAGDKWFIVNCIFTFIVICIFTLVMYDLYIFVCVCVRCFLLSFRWKHQKLSLLLFQCVR